MSIVARKRGAGPAHAKSRGSKAFTFMGLIASLTMVLGGLMVVGATSASAVEIAPNTVGSVTICHAHGRGAVDNPYNTETISVNAVNNPNNPSGNADLDPNGNGHGGSQGTHGGDIIPPITVGGQPYYPGKNWTPENELIWGNDCSPVTPPPACTPPQVLDPQTKTCVTPPVECTLPQVRDPQTNTCVTPPVECTLPQVLDPQTNTCVTPPVECVLPQVLDPQTNTCVTPPPPPVECVLPQVLNAAGTACIDPPQTTVVTPPTTTTPVTTTAVPVSEPLPAVTTPETVVTPAAAQPEAATVPETVPETVPAPEAATVPTAVNAGGGSSAPGVPLWGIALLTVGVLGAAGAGSRLLAAMKK